jgi:hypothetical protein
MGHYIHKSPTGDRILIQLSPDRMFTFHVTNINIIIPPKPMLLHRSFPAKILYKIFYSACCLFKDALSS